MLDSYYVLWTLEEIGIINEYNTDPKVHRLFLILLFSHLFIHPVNKSYITWRVRHISKNNTAMQ